MATDILLQNGANPDDIVLTRPSSEAQEYEKEALWECESKGHRNLMELMLNCETEVKADSDFPENVQGKSTLLHITSSYCQTENIMLLVQRGADCNKVTVSFSD
jgi:hypothetical protein